MWCTHVLTRTKSHSKKPQFLLGLHTSVFFLAVGTHRPSPNVGDLYTHPCSKITMYFLPCQLTSYICLHFLGRHFSCTATSCFLACSSCRIEIPGLSFSMSADGGYSRYSPKWMGMPKHTLFHSEATPNLCTSLLDSKSYCGEECHHWQFSH